MTVWTIWFGATAIYFVLVLVALARTSTDIDLIGDAVNNLSDEKQSEADGRLTALMMLAGGCHPRDAARVLRVQPEQICAWMAYGPTKRRDPGEGGT
jgi:hypothetical protein